jgi:predicted transcriptional regulator
MKSASFPSLRVKPELRNAAEQVLQQGETLSSFIESSIRANIDRRLSQKEFIARGLASRDRARMTGEYVDADLVVERLQEMLLEVKKHKP